MLRRGFVEGERSVVAPLAKYNRYSRRRRRRAERAHQRLDIQGLRMMAVLTVFANHLWDFPRGGFVGVDVFFVISGFLITSNLLRAAENMQSASAKLFFWTFYWNRIRRIVPAATVVLLLTYLVGTVAFLPFRAQEIGVDALWAFAFLSNWWFAVEGTDYFRAAADTVSPLQHYWSLSIEEQFYFVWPAVIFVIGLYVAKKAWTHEHRMRIAGCTMAVIVGLSFGWAWYETVVSPTWAYFNTFARVWELGVGALLATAVGGLGRTPVAWKPLLSWGGVALIGASVLLIGDDSGGFPAPWALLPVLGSALVIAAGVNGEPAYQPFLRNPVSGYIGDISYSLYLVHWPVIVILGSLMDVSWSYYLAAIGLGFGLAIASYQFVETPLRRADLAKLRAVIRDIRKRRYHPQRSSGYAALTALTLITIALVGYAQRPDAYEESTPPPMAVVAPQELDPSGPEPQVGPLAADLQGQIIEALKAREWPDLQPSLEEVITGKLLHPALDGCVSDQVEVGSACTYGDASAPFRIVIVGDSVGLGYAAALREIAVNSGGKIQLLNLAMASCAFTNDLMYRAALLPNCTARKQYAVDEINRLRPNLVVVSNLYLRSQIVGEERYVSARDWSDTVRAIVDKFRGSVERVALLAPPPGDVNIKECFSLDSPIDPRRGGEFGCALWSRGGPLCGIR
ncbi:acyltransferase family protein [Mycolicibacterium pyrenivorans]|uniref:acyltransferase family protein n=1 Tax=Mycolicibacterium pyrenivorans TaxID=187102 RepID=UPI0021F35E31|nr:acyltransferase family protein [Mycolicibacterium pyrenivorans]MCV7150746.1 acyltransferase [Mycolicibacterium pyrenivorans]